MEAQKNLTLAEIKKMLKKFKVKFSSPKGKRRVTLTKIGHIAWIGSRSDGKWEIQLRPPYIGGLQAYIHNQNDLVAIASMAYIVQSLIKS